MEENKIKITVNGTEREAPAGLSISGLLDFLNVRKETAIVEHNLNIIKSREHDGTAVNDGDRIEIVRFVGGG